jgi:hypothetical protein
MNVTREHAGKIVKKLRAQERDSTHHKYYDIWDDGTLLLTFGVSHTPKKDKPQNHLPKDLCLSQYETIQLAQCQISRDDYIKKLRVPVEPASHEAAEVREENLSED